MSDQIDYFYSIRPCLGERVSGDTVIVDQREQLLFVAIIDALGHGVNAHQVARKAQDYLQQFWHDDVCQTMVHLNQELQGSLGAAVGLAVVDLKSNQLSYTGVGNTVIRILRQQQTSSQRLYSTEGIVGGQIRSPQKQTIYLSPSDLVLLYTDGVKEHFQLQAYPLIFTDDVMTITKKLIRLFGKEHDDATCVALKYKT